RGGVTRGRRAAGPRTAPIDAQLRAGRRIQPGRTGTRVEDAVQPARASRVAGDTTQRAPGTGADRAPAPVRRPCRGRVARTPTWPLPRHGQGRTRARRPARG